MLGTVATYRRAMAHIAGLAGLAGLAVCASSCGAASSTSAASPTTWTVAVAPVSGQTLSAALAKIKTLSSGAVPVGTLTAAVFALGDPEPDMAAGQWQTLISTLCGPGTGLVATAMSYGWTLQVDGFADSTGSASFNATLESLRAANAAHAIEQTCAVPPTRVHINAGGIDGLGPDARKVTVKFVK